MLSPYHRDRGFHGARARAAVAASVLAMMAVAIPAAAESPEPAHHRLAVHFGPDAAVPVIGLGRGVTFAPARISDPASQEAAPAVATEYSDAYRVRAKVHRIGSFAMIPLFVAQGLIGQSLYNSSSSGGRGAHAAVGAAIGVLFGVDTVTGVWNMVESRHDANGRGRRMLHGVLMMAADAGFLATSMTTPERERGFRERGGASPATHRAIAFTSMGLATVGYLVMLIGGR
jgi:hypothetical protein